MEIRLNTEQKQVRVQQSSVKSSVHEPTLRALSTHETAKYFFKEVTSDSLCPLGCEQLAASARDLIKVGLDLCGPFCQKISELCEKERMFSFMLFKKIG